MTQMRILYQMDNASFDETPLPETEKIFAEIIQGIKNGQVGGLIQDINGNGIGSWVMEGHDERYATQEEDCEHCDSEGNVRYGPYHDSIEPCAVCEEE